MVAEKKQVKDIVVQRTGQIAYVYFNFNQGLINTQQCFVLKQVIAQIKSTDVKVIVLMGGEQSWCNGIHVNNVNISPTPIVERKQNIAALDDLVREIANTPDQITVAAIRNDIGAGAIALAMACDNVVVRQSVVFNPDNQVIDLYGQSNWRFALNKAIGKYAASKLADKSDPFLAAELVQFGLADKMLADEWATYHAALFEFCEQLIDNVGFERFLQRKEIKFADAYKPVSRQCISDSVYRHTFYHRDDEPEQEEFVYGVKPAEHHPSMVSAAF